MYPLSPEGAPPNNVPRVATFFALYPEPLGLTDGTYFCTALRSSPVRGFSTKIALRLKENETPIWLAPQLSQTLVVSVRFHPAHREPSPLAGNYAMPIPLLRAVG